MKNPVLRGFNPDPSALVHHGFVYVAVSTFQWVPGVTIYKTDDLVNYTIASTPLTHLDLRGNPVDTSIWAPQLSYVDGLFYLVYTIVKVTLRPFKDLHNYVVTSPSIEGPWSEPIYLNSSGFDPSFFHEGDKSYLLQEIWDYRIKEDNKFAGIIIQPFDRRSMRLIDTPKTIFMGTEAKKTEGPHLYHIDDYYYLITAEGGTKESHQVTIARSKQLMGPYELDPKNPMMTSKNNTHLYLQCAGHASLIKFNDRYYLYHLATRGYPSILGRETALQEVYLDHEGWLRLYENNEPKDTLNLPNRLNATSFYQDFKKPLTSDWLFLRKMPNDWIKPHEEGVTVYGGDSLSSLFDMSVLGFRLDEFHAKITLNFCFEPKHFNEMAGIGLYLDETKHLFFYVSHDETLGKIATLYRKNVLEYHFFDEKIKLDDGRIAMSILVKDGYCEFSVNNITLETKISHDFLIYNFTGTAVMIAVSDLNVRHHAYATLHNFSYQSWHQS